MKTRLTALACLLMLSGACATYKVTQIADHNGKLWMTTEKKTTFMYRWVISESQAVVACEEQHLNGRDTLQCHDMSVYIDGKPWSQ